MARSKHLAAVVCLIALSPLLLAAVAVPQAGASGLGHLSGGTWAIEASPNAPGAISSQLRGVSCPGPNGCVAVGAAFTSGTAEQALIEQLSGGTWSIANGAALPGATNSLLYAASCPVADFCAAVGYARYQPPQAAWAPLAEIWDGQAWSMAPLPLPANASLPSLFAVSCPVAGGCVAVGNYLDTQTNEYQPLAEELLHGTWSVLTDPAPFGTSASGDFTAVACTLPASCEVLGNAIYDGALSVLAYDLTPAGWVDQDMPNPGVNTAYADSAVSCAAAVSCTAVGENLTSLATGLAQTWDGSAWVVQAPPVPPSLPDNSLSGVSCPTGSIWCLAVGTATALGAVNQAMSDVWDGTSWASSPALSVPGQVTSLAAVSCPSATSCIAVGSASVSTLIEAFTG